MSEVPDDNGTVAVVGMACRFPGAPGVDTYWANLRDSVESVRRFTDDELAALGVPPDVLSHPDFVPVGAVIDEPDKFDHRFWGYAPREAALIDPQQRVFLETAWEALEHAGCNPYGFDGLIGVYAGMGMSRYLLHNLFGHPGLSASDAALLTLSNDKDFLSTRASYHLNLRGPSVTVQTGCSTSLVATHLACDALLSYQCDVALAGGCTIHLPHLTGYIHNPQGTTSPDGHSRAFDTGAAGTVFGSGAGVVVLKRLADAIADRDSIYAVIRGSAVNNDGSQKVGFASPGVAGQAEVIVRAQQIAQVAARTLGYVEAHGSATRLGDPIEVRALTKAFRTDTDEVGFCALGSVKTNIGHLDAAAGVAGLLKAVFALHHKQIPASLHFRTPNPEIDFASSPFFVNTELRPWEAGPTPRRAGVSAFGFGGTNSHVVVEEAPHRPSVPAPPDRPQIVLVSAKTPMALEAATQRLVRRLESTSAPPLADVAHTTQVGRAIFDYRRAVACREVDEAAQALAGQRPRRRFDRHEQRLDRAVTFMFSGLGEQYPAMARDLYEAGDEFTAALDHCAEVLKPLLLKDIRSLLYPAGTASVPAGRHLDFAAMVGRARATVPETDFLTSTETAHPVLFAVQYALARQWMADGVMPSAVIGHSLGEYAAATICGVFSVENALALVARRAQLIEALPPGAMLAVSLAAGDIRARLGGAWLSLINGPNLVVAAGAEEVIAELEARLRSDEVPCRRINARHAFHTPMMQSVVPELEALIGTMERRPPRLPMISGITGSWLSVEQATNASFWARQSAQTVNFADGIRLLCQERDDVLIEIGPGQALCALAAEQMMLPGTGPDGLVLPSLRSAYDRRGNDLDFLYEALAQAAIAGARLDWRRLNRGVARKVALPTYPFHRERAWIDRPSQEDNTPAYVDNRDRVVTYARAWRSVPLPPSDSTGAQDETWLILGADNGFASRLADAIESETARAILVRCATAFEMVSQSAYCINLADPQHVSRLWDELHRPGHGVTGVIFLPSLRSGVDAEPEIAAIERDLGCLAAVAEAVRSHGTKTPVPLWILTEDALPLDGRRPLDPTHAALVSAALCLPQEYREIAAGLVDLTDEEASSVPQKLLTLLRHPPNERVYACRGNRRWIPIWEPLQAADNGAAPWRAGGTYLITGGLGNIGLDIADHVSLVPGIKLVLLDTSEPSVDVSARLAALRQRGARVLTLRVDPADREQMRTAIQRVEREMGAITGVVQANAVAAADAAMAVGGWDSQRCGAMLRAKVRAAEVLHELFAGNRLEFCLLLSSNAAFLGGHGLMAFSAACNYLDALAWVRSRTGEPWISVNLDEWLRQSAGSSYALEPRQAIAAIEQVLRCGQEPQVAVVRGDLRERLLRWTDLAPDHPGTVSSSLARAARPQLDTEFAAPDGEYETAVAEIWQDVLGIEAVGRHDDYYELGGHSLLAIHIATRTRERFGVDAPLVSVYGAPTVELFARFVRSLQTISPGPVAASPQPGGSLLRRLGPAKDGAISLLCVPFSGAGISVFRAWPPMIGDGVELWGVQLPGREDRLAEPPLSDLNQILDGLEKEAADLFAGPFALFGHSMGAIVAWALAQRLWRRQGLLPRRFFVSGSRPPHLSPLAEPWHRLPDDRLVKLLRRLQATSPQILDDPNILQHFMPAIRADLTVAETYGGMGLEPLPCPMTVFTGRDDPNIDVHEADRWRDMTTSAFELRVLAGGHLFLLDSGEDITRMIAARLVGGTG